MKIILSGGGTLGPVSPLLAIFETYKKHDPSSVFVWVGTKNGLEHKLVENYGIPFFAITSGKLRRYFSFLNFVDVFKIAWGFFQSLFLLWQEKPDLLITAGGYVSVPLHYAAATLGIPTWVHQQDIEVGLANKLMAKSAKKITVALKENFVSFDENKTEWLGNPVRNLNAPNLFAAREKFGIPQNVPVIFALGGGTGSNTVNKMILEALPLLPRDWHIVHLVGKERPNELQVKAMGVFSNYHVYQFFTEEMKYAYAIASVVVARAGFATITELASLSKPAILVPISNNHQEVNARLLAENKAAVVLNEKFDDGQKLAHILKDLIEYPEVAKFLGNKLHEVLPPAKPERVIEILEDLAKQG